MSAKTCWFCDGKAYQENAYHVEGSEATMNLELSETRRHLVFDGTCEDPYDGVRAEFVINYCPICGRRL